MQPFGAKRSLAYGTDDSRQCGGFGENSSNMSACIWSGTADSCVSLNPENALSSFALDIWGDAQVGSANISGVSHAALWHNTPESFIDMHPTNYDALNSRIKRTTGSLHCGSVSINGLYHASIWLGDSPENWMDLHEFLGEEYAQGWSVTNMIYQSGDDIWVTGSVGYINENGYWADSKAVIWSYQSKSIEDLLLQLESLILGIDDANVFKNNAENRKKALSNKIQAVIDLVKAAENETDPQIIQDLYLEAIDELECDIQAKMDGCLGGHPKNDWIVVCSAQEDLNIQIDIILDALYQQIL